MTFASGIWRTWGSRKQIQEVRIQIVGGTNTMENDITMTAFRPQAHESVNRGTPIPFTVLQRRDPGIVALPRVRCFASGSTPDIEPIPKFPGHYLSATILP